MTEKLGKLLKEQMVRELRNQLRVSPTFFIIRTAGLTALDMEKLRRVLRLNSSHCWVIKNTISKLALREFQLDELINLIDGPSAFVFSLLDPIVTSKTLINFSKEHTALRINGGYLDGKVMSPELIKQLASLPSREILLTKIICGMKSPLFNLTAVLTGTLRKFVCALKEVGKKKEGLS